MVGEELRWTELLILILVIIIGVSAGAFYYAGLVMEYEGTPILVMQMLSIVVQLVVLSAVYKIHLTIKEYISKGRLKK